MKTFLQDGRSLLYSNDGDDAIASGDVVVIGSLLGVAAVDIAAGDGGTVVVEGVFTVPKTAGSAITQGDPVIWDVSAGAVIPSSGTAASGDVSGAAVCWIAAASADTSCTVKIGAVGTVTA